jgi:hypothetical protein
LTVKLNAWPPVKPATFASVAVIVNEDEPTVVGVPLRTPVFAFKESPAGRLPAVTA